MGILRHLRSPANVGHGAVMAPPAHEGEARIGRLPELIEALPARERRVVERLFWVVASEGELEPPSEMEPWLERTFGSVEAARRQRIVRVTNRWTFEGAIFNPLRSRRPGAGALTATQAGVAPELRERIARAEGDDFEQPEQRTPAERFGRIRGARSVTASNVAKADGWHGVVIFDTHDPLALDAALVADVFDVTRRWAERAREHDPEARHLFLLWNCLWKAGASLVHGHAQMTLGQGMAQARVEGLRAAAARYRRETGGEYFSDLLAAHAALGLAAPTGDAGVARFASLTPVKEREVTLLAPLDGSLPLVRWERLAAPLAATLRVALDELGVRAFNVAAFGPPLDLARDGDATWRRFPLVARFVDRGDPLAPTSDIAALELFGSSVVASDPFDVARALRATGA